MNTAPRDPGSRCGRRRRSARSVRDRRWLDSAVAFEHRTIRLSGRRIGVPRRPGGSTSPHPSISSPSSPRPGRTRAPAARRDHRSPPGAERAARIGSHCDNRTIIGADAVLRRSPPELYPTAAKTDARIPPAHPLGAAAKRPPHTLGGSSDSFSRYNLDPGPRRRAPHWMARFRRRDQPPRRFGESATPCRPTCTAARQSHRPASSDAREASARHDR